MKEKLIKFAVAISLALLLYLSSIYLKAHLSDQLRDNLRISFLIMMTASLACGWFAIHFRQRFPKIYRLSPIFIVMTGFAAIVVAILSIADEESRPW